MNRMIKRSAILFLTLMACVGSSLPVHAQARPELKVFTPEAGKTYQEPVIFKAFIRGDSDEPYTVKLSCFDRTHYLLVTPRVELLDEFLPTKPGSHVLKISVWARGKPRPLLEQEVRFTVEKPGLDIERMDSLRRGLAERSLDPHRERAKYALICAQARVDPKRKNRIANQAKRVYYAHVSHFFTRISIFTNIAKLHEKNFDPARALQALQFAHSIFESELETVAVHPITGLKKRPYWENSVKAAPDHFRALADLYARAGDLKNAVEWHQRFSAWYREQLVRPDLKEREKQLCRQYMSEAFDRIALLHYLIKKDRAAHDAWREKARKLRAGE